MKSIRTRFSAIAPAEGFSSDGSVGNAFATPLEGTPADSASVSRSFSRTSRSLSSPCFVSVETPTPGRITFVTAMPINTAIAVVPRKKPIVARPGTPSLRTSPIPNTPPITLVTTSGTTIMNSRFRKMSPPMASDIANRGKNQATAIASTIAIQM